MIVGTAGHIDHGKSSLVRALTGVDPDRLKEEKARGITLDLGYAYQPLPDGRVLGFVDVPGHERLVHTMLAGATGIDFVLLVIAADDGPMPQTREHLDILQLLGLTRAAVVLTKIDKVDAARRTAVAAEIATLLTPTALAGAPLFAVSSVTGEGVDALRRHLHGAAASHPQRSADGYFRLAIDRCFTLPGAGTVVAGTVHSGCVNVGDRLRLSDGTDVRVRSLHVQNQAARVGNAGRRCAVNLTGSGLDRHRIHRGDWLLHPDLLAPTTRLDGVLRVLPNAPGPLRHWMPVHVHLGAADIPGRVAVLDGEAITPGTSGWVQLILDTPTVALWGDRFVLRDQSATHTIGGGQILDSAPPLRGRRRPARLAILRALQAADPLAALKAAVVHAEKGIDLTYYARLRNINPDALAGEAADAGLTVIPAANGPVAFTAERWRSMEETVLEALAQEHRSHPHRLGPDKERLRRISTPGLERPLFAALLAGLAERQSLRFTGPVVHLSTHRVTLAPADERLWREHIRPLLDAQPFSPPRVRDIARVLDIQESRVRTLMHQLCAMAEVQRVAHDHYFTRAAVQALAAIVHELAETDGEVRAAAFRDRIGTGRKLAIQILEFFDALGLSRRIGDAHRVYADTLLRTHDGRMG
jgi:selenocysteine-specific elongation factor